MKTIIFMIETLINDMENNIRMIDYHYYNSMIFSIISPYFERLSHLHCPFISVLFKQTGSVFLAFNKRRNLIHKKPVKVFSFRIIVCLLSLCLEFFNNLYEIFIPVIRCFLLFCTRRNINYLF